MVERAVDEGLDLFAGQGGFRGRALPGGVRVAGREQEPLRGLGLRWRGRWFRLLGLGGGGLLHLAFNLRTLGDHQACFLAGHLQDLQLFGRAFLSPSGLVRSDMFNLREHYYLQHVDGRRHQRQDARESRGVVVLVLSFFRSSWRRRRSWMVEVGRVVFADRMALAPSMRHMTCSALPVDPLTTPPFCKMSTAGSRSLRKRSTRRSHSQRSAGTRPLSP